jgi:hypothetical protein
MCSYAADDLRRASGIDTRCALGSLSITSRTCSRPGDYTIVGLSGG